ncbi:addiction module protein [Phycisphaeraceae bacterium D3-23]
MTDKAKQVLDAALALDVDERTILIAQLSESLHDKIDPEIEKAWIAECERRWSAYERGETETRPAEEVFEELRNRHKST